MRMGRCVHVCMRACVCVALPPPWAVAQRGGLPRLGKVQGWHRGLQRRRGQVSFKDPGRGSGWGPPEVRYNGGGVPERSPTLKTCLGGERLARWVQWHIARLEAQMFSTHIWMPYSPPRGHNIENTNLTKTGGNAHGNRSLSFSQARTAQPMAKERPFTASWLAPASPRRRRRK